ncbi:TPA: hypothetical protein PMC50_003373 [Vibrio cholerae]|nr:hypothetical protein [Vibrio cholerae]
MSKETLHIHYYNDQGDKINISVEELFIELSNGQTLTLSNDGVELGLYIGDHSCHNEGFAVLILQPSSCNSLRINSILHQINHHTQLDKDEK